ncbi:MAG: TetR/AcrR family transcriptional regulator [Nitriliruptoraceae bacterium]|nr:TetR/AcrR family transcriptional regulator [Nitriliruptoraceae bacterium]
MTTIETRHRILEVAGELFTAQGIAATPLREIAERLDFTKAALYYHFPSKDDLLVALITPLHDDLGAVLTRVEEGTAETTPEQLLAHLLDAHLAHASATRLSRDPAVRQVERLHARAAQLHARATTALVRNHAEQTAWLQASAALAVIDELTIRCTPDQHHLVRRIGPTAAAATLTADPSSNADPTSTQVASRQEPGNATA